MHRLAIFPNGVERHHRAGFSGWVASTKPHDDLTFGGRGKPKKANRLTSVRRGIARSLAARVWLPEHWFKASRMRCRSPSREGAAAPTSAAHDGGVKPRGGVGVADEMLADDTGFDSSAVACWRGIPRSLGSMTVVEQRRTARSMALSSPRTLSGHPVPDSSRFVA